MLYIKKRMFYTTVIKDGRKKITDTQEAVSLLTFLKKKKVLLLLEKTWNHMGMNQWTPFTKSPEKLALSSWN